MDRICPSPFPILVVAVGASPLPTVLVTLHSHQLDVVWYLNSSGPCCMSMHIRAHIYKKKVDQRGMGHNELTVF
jgi:hypothetical protein